MRGILSKVKYYFWMLNGQLGWRSRSNIPQRLTVLITYYTPMRMKHINHQIRNILKCDFVERLVVSNHNPEIQMDSLVRVKDARLRIVNQEVRRNCGYRWKIALQYPSDYLVVIDDDVLLFPWQLRKLFNGLIAEPEIPHGFAGMRLAKDGGYTYHEREDMRVDYLCEVYGVTNRHVERYFEIERLIVEQDQSLSEAVERLGDYIVISQTADENPVIHDGGRLFRSETFKSQGVANHKDKDFLQVLADVTRAIGKIRKPLNF